MISPFELRGIWSSSFVFLGGCQTTPTKFETIQKGRWQTKMLVRDHKESKSQIVNLDIVAVRPDKLRVEVTTSLGMHLASLVMNNGEFRGAIVNQKRFLIGPATPYSFSNVIGVPLDPRLFMNLLFDEAPTTKDWVCVLDKNQFLESCENKNQSLKLGWKDREVSRRKVELEAKTFSIQMLLQGFSTKVEEAPETFTLNAPDGFKTERIR